MILETAYANGQLAALLRHKLAWPAATDPTVADSAVLQAQSAKPLSQSAQNNLQPPTTPLGLAQVFNAHEQGKTRTEPRRKLSADDICTSCRKTKHYGPCTAPRPIPTKVADFNMGMNGSDPTGGNDPSTSPHYHAATTADSSLGRARDGQPAGVQAQTAFADLFRHLGISNAADEPGQMTGGLNKVALNPIATGALIGAGAGALHAQPGHRMHGALGGAALGGVSGHVLGSGKFPNLTSALADPAGDIAAHASDRAAQELFRINTEHMPGLFNYASCDSERERRHALLFKMYGINLSKAADWQLWGTGGHSTHEQRGGVNPYEEQRTRLTPPVGWGDEGLQRIERAFDQIDHVTDTTGIEDASKGAPSGGPAVLG